MKKKHMSKIIGFICSISLLFPLFPLSNVEATPTHLLPPLNKSQQIPGSMAWKLAEFQEKAEYSPSTANKLRTSPLQCMDLAKNFYQYIWGDQNRLADINYHGKWEDNSSNWNTFLVGRYVTDVSTCNVVLPNVADNPDVHDNVSVITADNVKTLLSKANVGDIIQVCSMTSFRNGYEGCPYMTPHTMILQEKKKDSVIVYHCNIDWGSKRIICCSEYTFNDFAKTFNHSIAVYTTRKDCSPHKFNDAGICQQCYTDFPLNFDLEKSLMYTTRASVPAHKTPYAVSPVTKRYSGLDLPVPVIGSAINFKGNLWYKTADNNWIVWDYLTEKLPYSAALGMSLYGSSNSDTSIQGDSESKSEKPKDFGYVPTTPSAPSESGVGNEKKTEIAVSTIGVEEVTESNAIVNGRVTKPNGITIPTCGLYFGTSPSALEKVAEEKVSDAANANDGWFKIFYDLNSDLYISLEPGTTYYWQNYVIYDDREFKSDINSFTTKKANISVDSTLATEVTSSNAVVNGTVYRPTGLYIEKCGIYFGKSESSMKKVAEDSLSRDCEASLYPDYFVMFFDLNDEAGQVLSAHTRYYWQCYVICNGREIRGNINSFTTR